jgi:hypothetical protein
MSTSGVGGDSETAVFVSMSVEYTSSDAVSADCASVSVSVFDSSESLGAKSVIPD